jgi:hypothetical protein
MDLHQSYQKPETVETTTSSQKFEDSDFEALDKIFKNSCFIMVPESEIINFTMQTYVKNILRHYDERLDVEPYIDASLSEVEDDFKDYEDSFENIHEFCKKIYGGYIEGTNIMSTINYNAEWSYYKPMYTYSAKEVPNLNLPINIKCIVDLNMKLHKKNKTETDDDWNKRMLKLIVDSDVDNNLFLEYVEYF